MAKQTEWAFYGIGIRAGNEGRFQPYHCDGNTRLGTKYMSPETRPSMALCEALKRVDGEIRERRDARFGSVRFDPAVLIAGHRVQGHDRYRFTRVKWDDTKVQCDFWQFPKWWGRYREVEVCEYAPSEDEVAREGWDTEALVADLDSACITDALGFPILDNLGVFGVFDRGTLSHAGGP